MVLKTDLEKVIAKVKTERDFAIERLEKSYETNFKLRQQIIKLEKQIDLPKSLTKSESKI